MNYLRVKGWENFQHYKDRNPPWIKLHRDLLRDYEFSCLQDASKLLLMEIWLLASQLDNRIPNDPNWLKRQLPYDGDIDLKPLIDSGFLVVEQGASKMLAGCKQSAMPETETETETEQQDAAPSASASGVQQKRLNHWDIAESYGIPRSVMGKAIKQFGKEAAEAAVQQVIREQPAEPIAFFVGASANGTTRQTGNGTGARALQTPASRGKAALERLEREDRKKTLAANA